MRHERLVALIHHGARRRRLARTRRAAPFPGRPPSAADPGPPHDSPCQSRPRLAGAPGACGGRRSSTRPLIVPAAGPRSCAEGVANNASAKSANSAKVGRRNLTLRASEPEHELRCGELQAVHPAPGTSVELIRNLQYQIALNRVTAADLDTCHRSIPAVTPECAGDLTEAQMIQACRSVKPGFDLGTALRAMFRSTPTAIE